MTTITLGPTPPNRQDPDNFSDASDAFAAWMVVMAAQANALASEVNAMSASAEANAATATTKASDAAAARDIAMAAVNYKGAWSSLSGALAIPASAFHSGSIWMLTVNVANVAAEVPGVSAKWLNVTPASGLGSAAYQPASAFQAAIGALTGLLRSDGSGAISAATAAQIVAAIGAVYVANAAHATSADSADSAVSIMDGTVNSAAKIANSIITWTKMAAMATGKLIGRSTAGSGNPEEITLGARLSLVGGVLSADAAPVTSVGGKAGVVTSAQVAEAAIAGAYITAGTTYTKTHLLVALGGAQVEMANARVNVAGTVRVTLRLAGVQFYNAYAQLYKNGSAVSTLYANVNAAGIDYSADFSVAVGDTFQVFARADGSGTIDLSFGVGVSAYFGDVASAIAIGAR